MDLRLKQLSYSSVLLLHGCPRKYQLTKLSVTPQEAEDNEAARSQGVTFAFGHAIGVGIQSTFENKSFDSVLMDMFMSWNWDLLDENPKQKKSFWTAVLAIEKFQAVKELILDGYELVHYNGKPACELSFLIDLGDEFAYRGFVDLVLHHRETKEIVVLEVKSTSLTGLTAAQYKESFQAIGYSVVLDELFPELSSYKVIYLVYKTKTEEWEPIPFTKTYYQRAEWIQELLLEKSKLELYDSAGVFPKHGEHCTTWGRECEFLGVCKLSLSKLTKPLDEEGIQKIVDERSSYQVTTSIFNLIQTQLNKVNSEEAEVTDGETL